MNFNKDITDMISNSVRHLTFSKAFTHSIIDAIPNSVTHLTFGDCFNREIKVSIQ